MTQADVNVILHRLDAMHDDLRELKDHDIRELREQAAKTNGRVTHLELWRARIEGARGAWSWVPAVLIGALGTGLGAALAAVLLH